MKEIFIFKKSFYLFFNNGGVKNEKNKGINEIYLTDRRGI